MTGQPGQRLLVVRALADGAATAVTATACTAPTCTASVLLLRPPPLQYTYEKEIVMYAYFKRLDYFSTGVGGLGLDGCCSG